ncbi:MAG: ATP-binding cassette domain-containing protein [Thermoanaerobaculia bacterium]
MSLRECIWPTEHLGQAVYALLKESFPRQGASAPATPDPPAGLGDREALGRWVEAVAESHGLELEPFEGGMEELREVVAGAAPAVLEAGGSEGGGFLLLVGAGRRAARLLAPDGTVRRVPAEEVAAALSAPVERRFGAVADSVLDGLDLDSRGRLEARGAVLRQLGGSERLWLGWLVRLPPGSSTWAQLRDVGATRSLAGFVAVHAVQYLVWLGSWWLLGRGALQGRFEADWLAAWALLLAALVPLRMAVAWLEGRFALAAGGLLRRRLLDGALRQSPDDIRSEGTGQLLGRVVESEALESSAVNGGLASALALVEIVIAAVVLVLGAAPLAHAAALAAALAAVAVLSLRLHRRRQEWTRQRLDLTFDLVERLVGHRTLVVQQPRSRWHEEEDRRLEEYLASCRAMDRSWVLVKPVPHAWLVLGTALLVPAFVAGSASVGRFAVSLGGLLLVHQALETLVGGLAQLSSARISWQRIVDLFRAAGRRARPGRAELLASAAPSATGEPLVSARDLVYRYRGREDPALRGCRLEIRAGDRLLLEGPSGGGKSTLVSLLAGIRKPDGGLLLLGDLDHHSASPGAWRRVVAPVPQFHENHVLTETFLFNLLMGRQWPPDPRDVREADAVCRELGLGPLLEKMPGGLSQMVGEAGWRLSHGERSRLFIARALLQDPDVLLLDESFGALDPESLRQAMECVEHRARTLLVITHR